MILRLFLALLALLAPAIAHAHEMEGRWALRIDEATIFVFEMERAQDGEWHGRWTRPETFASNGAVFARLVGAKVLTSSAGIEFAGDVELTFDDPAPGAIPDIFRFRHLGPGRAQLTYVGTPLAPYPLIAVADGAGLGPFEAGRLYDRDNAVSDPALAPPPTPATPPQTPATPPPPPPVEADEPAATGMGSDFLEGI